MVVKTKNVKQEFKSEITRLKSTKAILFLINTFFWKNKIGPIIVFLFPFCVVLLCYLIDIPTKQDYTAFASSNILFVPLSATPVPLFTAPLLLVEIKKSILLKKIGQAHIGAFYYMVIAGTYFALLSFLSVLLCEIYWLIFMNVHIVDYFNIQDAFSVFYAIVCLVLVSISLGLLIGTTLKNPSPIPMIGIAVLFISFILSGTIVPPGDLAKVQAIKYINLFSPLNYPLTLVNINYYYWTTSSHNIFMVTHHFLIYGSTYPFPHPKNFWEFLMDYLEPATYVSFYNPWQKILCLIFPWVIVLGFNLISWKCFSWSAR